MTARELCWMAEKAARVRGAEIGWVLAHMAAMNPFGKKNVKHRPSNFDPYGQAPSILKTSDISVVRDALIKAAKNKRGKAVDCG